MSSSEINALLQLLLDDTSDIRVAAQGRLLEHGEAAVTALREAATSPDARLRSRSRALLGRLETDLLAASLTERLASPQCDLEEAMLLLSRVENPALDPDIIARELDRFGRELAAEFPACKTPREKAEALGRLLGEREGFRGNLEHYYDPDNSYIDAILRRRVGIPISLSALYMMVGRRAGLTLRGIGMPCHFLVQCECDGGTFIVDPYGHGRIMTRESCKTLLAGFRHSFREDYLRPVSDRDMVRRMISNLVHIYHERKDKKRLDRLYTFVNAIQGRGHA